MKTKTRGFYFISNVKITKNKYERWRKIVKTLKLSREAKQRLE